jgi:hypothetical protein
MRDVVKLFFLCVLLLPAVVYAQTYTIEEIQVAYSTGGNAQYTYDAGTGTLDWSQGGWSYIFTDLGPFIFDDSVLNFDWDLYSDDSSGGHAAAKFDIVGSWTVDLYDNTYGSDPVVQLVGGIYGSGPFGGRYWEEETGYEALDGKAWVTVTSSWADDGWALLNLGPDYTIVWDNDGVAGLDSDVTLDSGTGDIADYASDYSATNGLTITLFADQSQVIPEPVTVALLGLGSLVILRRKPRA